MRASGILLHISSLPSPYGIGTFGKAAYEFVDFLVKGKQKYWQVLPLGPTSYGDSPYQTFSVDAGNPYFIDLDLLAEEGLLHLDEYQHLEPKDPLRVDYGYQFEQRFPVLELAFRRFLLREDAAYQTFKEEQGWLDNYALFMALKWRNPDKSWDQWEREYKKRDPEALARFQAEHFEKIEFWKFLQYQFFKQWRALKTYANQSGIQIIGDMPIYVAYDSCDVWVQPHYWQLDDEFCPRAVAGVPPDQFTADGQLWGNPLYNYWEMKKDGYHWWVDRIKAGLEIFDLLRIDHFRGFESYYSVPFGEKTARNGRWIKGPGWDLFARIKVAFGEGRIIAEDLGYLTPKVRNLLKRCHYPGMKILQFGFDSGPDNEYLPHNYSQNAVVYPGTHDNQTLKGWIQGMSAEVYRNFSEYFRINADENTVRRAICECLKSVCDTCLIPLQDYLELGDEARFNTPSTLGGNWVWRMGKNDCSDELAARIKTWTELYDRSPEK
jgi:4-alpha-glucanotransferase